MSLAQKDLVSSLCTIVSFDQQRQYGSHREALAIVPKTNAGAAVPTEFFYRKPQSRRRLRWFVRIYPIFQRLNFPARIAR
jgi:hypothetical protein